MQQTPQSFSRVSAKRALSIVVLYLILGCIYIVVSDWALLTLVNPSYHSMAESAKGILFILVTAVVLLATFHGFLRSIERLIEERLQTDNALLAALERYPGPAMIFTEKCQGSYFNTLALSLLKISADEAVGASGRDLFAEEKFTGFLDFMDKALSTGQPSGGEVVYRYQTIPRFYSVAFVPIHSAGTLGKRVIVVATDISDRKYSAIRVDAQRRELRQIIDLIPNFVFAKDADGRYIMANKAFAQFHGLSVNEIIGLNVSTILPDAAITDDIIAQDEEVINQAVMVHRPCQTVMGASGDDRSFQVTKLPFLTEGDERNAILCIAVDITEQLEHQREIDRSRKQFQALVEHSLDPLFVYNDSEFITLVNEKACALVGMHSDELLGKHLSVALKYENGDDSASVDLPFCQDGASFQTAVHREGSDPIPVEIRVGSLPGDGGRAFLAEVRDISERLRIERETTDLAHLGLALSASRTSDEIARALFDAVSARLPVDAFFCSMRMSGKSKFRYKLRGCRVNGEMEFQPDLDHEISASSVHSEIYKGGPSLILRHADEDIDKELFPFSRCESSSQTMMFIPVSDGDQTFALISVQSFETGAYKPDDVKFVQKVVSLAAPAFESAQSARRGAVFARLGRELGAAGTAEEVAEQIAVMADDLTGWDCCVVALYSAEDDTLVYIYLSDIVNGKRERMREPNNSKKPNGFSRRVLTEGPFLLLREDSVEIENFVPLSRSPRPSLSMIWAPIPGKDGPTGFISLQSYAYQAYDGNDLDTLLALAGHCGAALNRTASQELLRYREERYQLAIESSGAAAYQMEYSTQEFLFINRQIETITGYTRDQITPALLKEITIELQVDPSCSGRVDQTGSRSYSRWRAVMKIRRRDGEERWVSDQSIQVENALGVAVGTLGILRDITDEKRTEIALRASEERYALSARGANDGLWDWNLQENTIYLSERWGEMLGLGPDDSLTDPEQWFERIHPFDLESSKGLMQDHLDGKTEHFESEVRTMHQDGRFRWMLIRGVAVRDKDGQATRIAGSQTDITNRVHTQERLLHDTLHDPLTGLPNRAFLMEHVAQCLGRARRRDSYRFAVVFMDLDNFKEINDSHGHLAGDNVLVAIAQRLKEIVRLNDIVARFAGDEFVLVLDSVESEADVLQILTRAQALIAEPIDGNDQLLTSACAGIALVTTAYANPEEVLRDADIALYQAKSEGSGRWKFFSADVTPDPEISTP